MKVQPIYVIDLKQRSPIYELMAMNKIRSALYKRGVVKERLRPTVYIDRSEIEIDDEIAKSWKNIKRQRHIGHQYVWIASLCKQYNLQGIELSIQSRDNEEDPSETMAYYLEESRMDANAKAVFKYFSLPLLKLSKKEMQDIAKQENWMDIMDLTWFCHHPLYHPFKKGMPCGVCNPCRIVVKEGFGHRIPFLLRYGGKYLKKIYNSSIMNHITFNK
jgi:hypothetical protein